MSLMGVKALTFDTSGTLLDWDLGAAPVLLDTVDRVGLYRPEFKVEVEILVAAL